MGDGTGPAGTGMAAGPRPSLQSAGKSGLIARLPPMRDSDLEPYRFTNAFPYLLTRVGVRMGEVFAQELAEQGLTLHMYRVLAALWEKDEQSLGDLSQMVSSENSTLSRLVGTMKRMRLVTRHRLETDGRSVRIGLTPEGRVVTERLIPRAMHYESVAVQGFDGAEIADLKAKLVRVFNNLQEIAPEPAAEEAPVEKKARAPRSRQPLRSEPARRKAAKVRLG